MAVSDTQKVDLLYKQSFRVAKTDGVKDPTGESIVSPLLVRGDKIWNNASQIPATPAVVAGVVESRTGASYVQATADNTTTQIGGIYPGWKTNLTNWIPPEFGSLYSVAVYVDTTGSTTPTTTGTQIFAAGSGGTGEYYFDYSAGVLTFIGGTIPAILTAGKSIFILGWRYIGNVGLNQAVALGNTDITGYINVSSTANVGGVANFRANVVANGQLIVANSISVGNIAGTNTEITGYINVSTTANVGGIANFRANVVANGQLIVSNTAALGNTTVTGFINVSTTAALGNTDITGYVNVSTTANVGGVANFRANVVANGQLIVANTATLGNTTVGTINSGNGTISGFGNTTTLSRVGTARATATLGGTANVDTGAETITTAAAHGFVNNDVILYSVAAGNTAIGGLSNNTIYYVVGANTTAFQLATTQGGSAINLTTNPGLETGHSFITSESVITPFTHWTGNSTVNASVNTTSIFIGNSTVNTLVTPTGITTGNGAFSGNVSINGNLVVYGTSVSVTAANFSTSDNLIYLNEAKVASVTGASANGTHFLYVANNTFTAGQVVTVTGVVPAGYNATANAITFANLTHFAVANTTSPGAFVSGGTARAKAAINPDLGFAGAYDDGTYRHAGFFRDADDGRFKVFDSYTPEPDAAVNIDTANVTFKFADFQANTVYAGYISAGNTSVTGFVNVSTTANVGGVANFRSNVVANGTLTVANSISVGNIAGTNTDITGYINVSTTANVGGVANFRANVVANGQLIVANSIAVGNAEVTGYINVSTTANVGGVANFRANVVANGQLIVANTISVGNSTVTGFINISSTANVGGVANFRANVVANGQLIVSNTASLGNTTVGTLGAGNTDITGYANVLGIPATFNANTGVDGATEVITTTSAHGFTNNETVRYVTSTGNTTLTGLTNGSIYYAINASGTTLSLATTPGGAVVNVTPTLVSETGHSLVPIKLYVSSSDGSITTSLGLANVANLRVMGNTTLSGPLTTGNTTIAGFINVSSTANVGGMLNARSDLVVNGTLSVANTATFGNVTAGTITGGNSNLTGSAFIIGSAATFNANTGVNGTTEFITTTAVHGFSNGDYVQYIVATGNTSVSGLTNANFYYVTNANTTAFTLSSTYNGANVNLTASAIVESGHTLIPRRITLGQDGSVSTSIGLANVSTLRVLSNAVVNGTLTVANSVSVGNIAGTNTDITGYINVSSTANVGGVANFRANVVANGVLTVANSISVGNTDITGYVNVSTTANVGGVANFRANVVANGQLIVANSISVGNIAGTNTDITGYINVSTTANVGGVANFRANVVANGTLTVANTISVGNTTVTGFINVSTTANVGGVATFNANVILGTTTISANGGVGSLGQVLTSGASGNVYWAAAGVTAGGSDTQVQFNDGGSALGGDAGLTYNKTTDILTVANTVVTNNIVANGTFTANGATGSAGQVLTSGAGAGNVYWSTVAAGGSTPGGVDTQVQFNDGGSALGGDAGLTYNKTTDTLSVANTIAVGNTSVNSAVVIGRYSLNFNATLNTLDFIFT